MYSYFPQFPLVELIDKNKDLANNYGDLCLYESDKTFFAK